MRRIKSVLVLQERIKQKERRYAMRRIRPVLVLLVILGVCFMSTCFVTNGFAAKDIKIAVMVPLTGTGAFYGKLERDVGLGVIDGINKEGIKGFGKMEVRVYDTATDPAIAIQQMERAVMRGAHIVWGGFLGGEEKAMAAKSDELKIPYIMNNSTPDESFPKSRRYTINPYGAAYELGEATARYLIDKGAKTYAFMGADYVWSRSWDKTMTLRLRGKGIKKVYTNRHEFSKVDFSADIAKLKELKPDALVRTYGGAGEYSGVKQMKDANYWPRLYIGELAGGCGQVMLDQLGEEYAAGLCNVSFQNPDNPKWKEFAREHMEKYGYRPSWFSDGIYDTLYLVKKAIEVAGTLEPDKLMKAIKAVAFDGVSGYQCGPFQEWGGAEKTAVYFLKYVKGSPSWSNKVGLHREVVYKAVVKPLPLEEKVELLKDVK